MAQEDDPELLEALRRSLEQTNLQESQLADALAESIRTHDHEIAQDLHRDQLAQIEQDLMSQTKPKREEASRYIEAQLLSNPTAVEPTEGEWQVVGNQTTTRLRYIPLNIEEGRRNNSRDPSVETGINRNNVEETCETPEKISGSSVRPTSRSHENIPYRPPNLHRSHTSSLSKSDQILPATESMSQVLNGSESQAFQATPEYRRPVHNQGGNMRYAGATGSTNEPLVVIDGQNVGCSYGAGGVSRFRAKGVEVVLDFYFNQGIPAVAMLPRSKVDTRTNINNDRVADDPDLLKRLEDQGRLAFTPAGAHDDHFLLSYAMNKGIDLISNDRFQKEVSEQETHTDARKLRNFLNEHLIPYTFINGEFVPNPKISQLGRSIHHSRARNS